MTARGVPRGNKEGMSQAQRIARNGLIVQLFTQGINDSVIAARVDLSVQQVRKILRDEGTRAGTLITASPLKLIEDALSTFQRAAEFYYQTVISSDDELVQTAAMKALVDVTARQGKMLAQLHLIPRHLGTLRNVIDFQSLAHQIVEKLVSLEKGDVSLPEAMAFFRRLTELGEPNGPPILPSGQVVVDVPVDAEVVPDKPKPRRRAVKKKKEEPDE